MARRLDVVRELFREPCSVDMLGLPRVPGGFDCAECGRVVVYVAGLTFDEAVRFRKRARSGAERVCGAYTLDRESRVVLRAAPNSSKVVAIALGALLAACETRAETSAEPGVSASARANGRPTAAPSRSAAVEPAASAPILPPATSAATSPSIASSAFAAVHDAKSAEPQCSKATVPGARRAAPRKARSKNDPEVLGGY